MRAYIYGWQNQLLLYDFTIFFLISQKLNTSEYTYLSPIISLDNLPLKDATIY